MIRIYVTAKGLKMKTIELEEARRLVAEGGVLPEAKRLKLQ